MNQLVGLQCRTRTSLTLRLAYGIGLEMVGLAGVRQ